MVVLGYLNKLKKGLVLAFGEHFLHDFSIKMFLIWFYQHCIKNDGFFH